MRQINRFYVFFLWIAVAIIAVGCAQKAPVFEKLEGFWRLERIYDLDTGETKECKRLFWAIQLGMIELRDLEKNGYGTYIGTYQYDPELKTFKLANFIDKRDQLLEAPLDKLGQFGIPLRNTTFRVLKLENGKMMLETAHLKLELTEF